MEVDIAKSKAVAKLLKAYKQDGKQFGIIQLHLESPINALKSGDQTITLEPGASMVADATMDGCIDGTLDTGTLTFGIQVKGHGEIAQGGMKFKMTLQSDLSGEKTGKELPLK
jgi:hypothetical protein